MHGELRRLVLLVLRRARFVRFGPSGTLGPVGVCWCLFGVRVDVIRRYSNNPQIRKQNCV